MKLFSRVKQILTGRSSHAAAEHRTTLHTSIEQSFRQENDALWVSVIPLAGFARFAEPGNPRGVQICVEHFGELPLPDAQLDALVRLLTNHERIADAILDRLWADLTGKSRDISMWWHDSLHAGDYWDEDWAVTRPTSADELGRLLTPQRITVRPPTTGVSSVVIEFDAPFEEEHGVGALVIGHRIVSIGYACDP